MTIVSRSLGIILCALALTACAPAGPTGFGPALGPYGYSEQKLESGAWKVSFTGNRQTERNAVETYALYRAAQITLKQGAGPTNGRRSAAMPTGPRPRAMSAKPTATMP